MLEQATLDVLARAAEIGLPEAAGVPASVYDPFLRPFIKKRVRRAIADASGVTTSTRGDHVLKLAFLRALPTPPAPFDANDARAVNEAFEKLAKPYLPERPPPSQAGPQGAAYRVSARDRDTLPLDVPPRPKRKPWPFTLALLALVIFAGLGVTSFVVAPYVMPSPLQKFAKTPLGKAASEPLADIVVASSWNGSPYKQKKARALIVTKDVEKQIGTAAMAELERVLDALPDTVRSEAETTDEAIEPLEGHVNSLNAHLARQKVPAFFHSYTTGFSGKRNVWLTSFFVEDRSELDVGGKTTKFVRGRRLDELNLTDATLYKGALEEWAIVSLDNLDLELVQGLLRPLAMDTPMGPEEWTPNDKSPEAELARVAGKLIVEEVRAHAKLDRDDAITLHSAISRRNDAMVSLNKMGVDVEATSRIRLAPSLVKNLERWSSTAFEGKLRDEVLRIDSRMKVYAKPLQPVIAELARIHEEHFAGRLYEEPLVVDPPPVDPDASPVVVEDRAPRLYGDKRSRAIAASKLAFLSRVQACPRLALWLTYRSLSENRIALGGALEMMLYEIDPKLRGKGLNGPDLAEAMKSALEAPPDRVREAARKAYETLMSRPPPPVTRKAL